MSWVVGRCTEGLVPTAKPLPKSWLYTTIYRPYSLSVCLVSVVSWSSLPFARLWRLTLNYVFEEMHLLWGTYFFQISSDMPKRSLLSLHNSISRPMGGEGGLTQLWSKCSDNHLSTSELFRIGTNTPYRVWVWNNHYLHYDQIAGLLSSVGYWVIQAKGAKGSRRLTC